MCPFHIFGVNARFIVKVAGSGGQPLTEDNFHFSLTSILAFICTYPSIITTCFLFLQEEYRKEHKTVDNRKKPTPWSDTVR
jgi:hypothetical protein